MAEALVMATFSENGLACLALRVEGDATNADGNSVAVEYIGRVPIDEAWAALSIAQQQAVLVAAAQAERNAVKAKVALAPQPSANVPAMRGTVTI